MIYVYDNHQLDTGGGGGGGGYPASGPGNLEPY